MEGVAPPFAAVLFDLDGVLRNTEPYHRMAYAQLARSLSGGAPPDAGEIAGKSNLQLYEALVARFGGPATAEELSQRHFRLVCQLLEEYRGQGIGTDLVKIFIGVMEEKNYPNMFIMTSQFNTGAKRLYQSLGFQPKCLLHDVIRKGVSEWLFMRPNRKLA